MEDRNVKIAAIIQGALIGAYLLFVVYQALNRPARKRKKR